MEECPIFIGADRTDGRPMFIKYLMGVAPGCLPAYVPTMFPAERACFASKIMAHNYAGSEALEVANDEHAQQAPEVDWARHAPEVYQYENDAPEVGKQGTMPPRFQVVCVRKSKRVQTPSAARMERDTDSSSTQARASPNDGVVCDPGLPSPSPSPPRW